MAQRVYSHRSSSASANSPVARQKYALRRTAISRKRAYVVVDHNHKSSSSSHAPSASDSSLPTDRLRPVLVPLHPNLRRLPSRIYSGQKEAMRDATYHNPISVGVKRKRVTRTNENAHSGGRGSGRMKRMRSESHEPYTSDDGGSSMSIDAASSAASSDTEDDDAVDSSVEHLIHEAPPRQLLRLRKDELANLYVAAGLTDDAELFTKQEIVDAILTARDDAAEIPPSSPRGDASTDCSSDDGNVAGDEETDVFPEHAMSNALRRRVTSADITRLNGRPPKGRSFSTSDILPREPAFETKKGAGNYRGLAENAGNMLRRKAPRGSSSSPPALICLAPLPSPPITRLRTRKTSIETNPSTSSKGKIKTQAKPSGSREEGHSADIANANFTSNTIQPSPRRLRSNRSGSTSRVPLMRKAKLKIGSLKEDDGSEPGEEEDDPEEEEEAEEEEEEVDELVSSASSTPPPPRGRRTPVKRRLRPRRAQTYIPAGNGDDGDGDDEDEGEEDDGEEDEVEDEIETGEGDEEETEITEEDEEIESAATEDDEEETVAVEPRKLRSGKIVGEGETAVELEEDNEEDCNSDVDVDVDAEAEEGEEYDELMDVDLTVATTKTLVRLRRDDLVRLCETRDLKVAGTKPQLAEALLQWRDRNAYDFSSPSSAGTARPPSTIRHGNNRSQTRSQTPVLRPGHIHVDGPRTPVSQNRKDNEADLELDLESLGLEDREIPPDKLTKLEKIGSGGFKDVFIGKLRGRRIAISEFRGQLSEMDIKELKLLGGFNHPNIVRFIGVSIPENTRETPVMIVSELCSNGDLFDYVRKAPAPPLRRILTMMLDIARGLEYLHLRKPSVIHRDCKSSNILITSKGIAKIADFGLAKVKQSTRSMVRSLVGTVNWQAPELWHAHPKYSYKVDVFSCAVVYWEMLQWHLPNHKFPWEGMNEHAIYEIVGARRQRPSISGLRKQWCPEIVDLIERMWAPDPPDRPTMSEVVETIEQLLC